MRVIARTVLALGVLIAILAIAVLGTFRWQAYARETKNRHEAAPKAGGLPAVALDLPPFGFSERPAPGAYGRQAQARRILGVLDAVGVRQATLVGHSFGGGPTMEAVLLAPARIRSLVLADAAIGLDTEPGGGGAAALVLRARPVRNALVAASVTNPLITGRLLTQFVANPAAVTPARLQVLQAQLVVHGATDAFGDWLLDFVTSREVALSTHADAYQALAVPTLVIWGDRDVTTPLAQGQRLAQVLRGARLAVMPGIGHMPQIEDAAQFNRLLLAFLEPSRR